MTIDYLKYGAVVAIVGAVYLIGYKHAETEGERAIEAMKLEYAQAVVDAQQKEKVKYEEQIAELVSRLNNLGSEHADRMRELERFRSSSGDLEACYRQRNDLASLCVRGESLLKRSLVYLNVQQ